MSTTTSLLHRDRGSISSNTSFFTRDRTASAQPTISPSLFTQSRTISTPLHLHDRRWSLQYPSIDAASFLSCRPPSPAPSAPLLAAPPSYSASNPEKGSLVANNYDRIIDAYFYYHTLEDALRAEGLGRGQVFEEVKRECDRLHASIICWRVARLRS